MRAWDERILLRIGRKYKKDEVVKGLMQVASNLQIEIGQSVSYNHELEDKIKELEERLTSLNAATIEEMQQSIKMKDNQIKKLNKQIKKLTEINRIILSRRVAEASNLTP